MKTEAEFCRENFERTEAGFDRKNETLKGLKETILEVAKPEVEIARTAQGIGFVANLGAGCFIARVGQQ
jgi:hypothetical protein